MVLERLDFSVGTALEGQSLIPAENRVKCQMITFTTAYDSREEVDGEVAKWLRSDDECPYFDPRHCYCPQLLTKID